MKDKKKAVYMKCPRCELNYIQKKDKYCDVCKAEMNLIDPNILIPDEETEEILCPVCKTNLMSTEETMCFLCSKELAEKLKSEEKEDWTEKDDEVEDEIDANDLEIPLSILEDEEIAEEEDESFDDEGPEVDDFDYEYVTAEEIDNMEFDDDDEDEDDFDDF